ncbi:metallophosphoesterase [Saccharicrinis fermentans]|uniref:metallophosphoesterase n=1 Tax=Saccharicrinis fermentans TaxID=982 RepID=UPI00138ABD76|nr:metallophosphoesterase [Saccharicrinis fermentans]
MKNVLSLLLILCLISCGTLRSPYYGHGSTDWELQTMPQNKQPVHTLFLVGDAGKLDDHTTGKNFVLDAVGKDLLSTSNPTTLVFLGDNIYPWGMPPKDKNDRASMEKKINASLELAKYCNGNTFFIPGNHDWKRGQKKGLKAVKRQEKYIEKYFEDDFEHKVKMYPGDGCGDPKEIKIHKDLVFVFIDSQWWLQNWEEEKSINKGCDIKTRADLLQRMEEIFLDHKNDEIVVLMHHPIKSNGEHGGHFSWKHHLFPLHEMKNLWIPLPVIGSVIPFYRKTTGNIQDIANKKYQELANGINNKALELGIDVIFASGHEHSLQYFEDHDLRYIVSGSGSKLNYTAAGGDAEFAREARGYAKINFYDNNESWVEFYTVSNFGEEAKLEFRKQLRQPKPGTVDIPQSYPSIIQKDTIVAANPAFKANKRKQFWLGKQYRNMWTTPVNVPVFNLEKELGGLKPIKKGGGMSSNSLRMEADDGKQYILRSIKKDYTKLVDEKYRSLKAMNIMKDLNSASHPYGALMLPTLSKAAGIYYTKPRLVYLKHQKQLGNYNALFSEELYLLEQRPNDDWSDTDHFGYSKKIIGYTDLLEILREKKSHFIDQPWVLKSRMFDLWIHDWDRHDDQWRWASFEEDDRTLYRPIPRDRDQAFYKFEGLIPWYVSTFLVKKFKTMKGDVKDVKNQSFNARYFDRYFLNQLQWSDWEAIIKELQNNMTDEVIASSIKSLPTEVQTMNQELVPLLKERRTNLLQMGRKLYEFISKEVEIVGTDDDDHFYIHKNKDGSVKISHIIPRKNKPDLQKYNRTFYPDETKEIRIYGLRGDDTFKITGDNHKKIKIRIIGGEDKDVATNESQANRIFAYDNNKGIQLEGEGFVNRTSNDLEVNEYDRNAFKYNTGLPLLTAGYTKDDGIWLGGSYTWTRQAWRKEPFKSKHKAYFSVAPGSQDAFTIGYAGHFSNILGQLDFVPAFNIDHPLIENFFGYGNESINHHYRKQYNWVRKRSTRIAPLFGWHSANEHRSFVFGPFYQTISLENSIGRVARDPQIGFSADELKRKHFGGGTAKYAIQVLDRENNPSNGFKINVGLTYFNELSGNKELWEFDSDATFYLTLSNRPKIVLVNSAGYQAVNGEPQFYQYPSLGNTSHLRGYRNDRFRGESLFYNNSDLRFKIVKWSNDYLPMDIGVLGGYDLGRVWLNGEHSNKWHQSQTLGMYLDILEMVILQPYYSLTPEGDYLSVAMKFNF